MTDLGDLIGQAPLGDQPATIPLAMYLRTLGDLYVARRDRDLARAELASARRELATWRSYGTGGTPAELVITRYEGMGDIPRIQEGGGTS